MYRYPLTATILLAAFAITACETGSPFKRQSIFSSTSPAPVVIYRSPQQMAATPWPRTNPPVPTIATPVQRPQSESQLRKLPDEQASKKERRPAKTAEQLLDDAKRQATQGPTPHGFINAAQVYVYVPNRVYSVITSPGFVTIIKLRPGETLNSAAAGDTTRWVVDDIEAGTKDEPKRGTSVIPTTPKDDPIQNAQTLLLIKPREPFLRTNLVITTSERTYIIDLKSLEKPIYHSAVAWTYPTDEMIIKRGETPSKAKSSDTLHHTTEQRGVKNYQYNVLTQKKSAPRWAPTRVYDDGFRTYVHFANDIDRYDLPPIHGIDPFGKLQLLNQRFDGNRYIINRLVDRAEMRYGPHRVAIQRVGYSLP